MHKDGQHLIKKVVIRFGIFKAYGNVNKHVYVRKKRFLYEICTSVFYIFISNSEYLCFSEENSSSLQKGTTQKKSKEYIVRIQNLRNKHQLGKSFKENPSKNNSWKIHINRTIRLNDALQENRLLNIDN